MPFSAAGSRLALRKPREGMKSAPTGAFLSNTMSNAVTLGVSQNRLDTIRPNLELFRDFGGAHAIVEVIDNRIDRHPRTARHRSAALHFGLDFDEFARKASNGGRTGRTAR